MSTTPQLRPRLVLREPEITCDQYVRIFPGEYLALCTNSKIYNDPSYRRWVCLLKWNIVQSNSCLEPTARGVPLFLSLGAQAKPHAGRRSRYFAEWIRANGGPPFRGDRLSPNVFTRRLAHVQIADTESHAPYSTVRAILNGETGAKSSHLISQSGSQVRQEVNDCEK